VLLPLPRRRRMLPARSTKRLYYAVWRFVGKPKQRFHDRVEGVGEIMISVWVRGVGYLYPYMYPKAYTRCPHVTN
jgi:hypothetical protein